MSDYFWQYGTLGALAIVGIGFVAVGFPRTASSGPRAPSREVHDLRVRRRSGRHGWSQTHIRYYMFAFLFVIFDVEAVFLFPLATVFEELRERGGRSSSR